MKYPEQFSATLAAILIAVATLCVTTPTTAASFDCQRAETPIEKAICSTPELSLLDDQLGAAYKAGVERSADKDKFRAESREWVNQIRNKCNSIQCLSLAYRSRISEMQNLGSPKSTSLAADKSAEFSSSELPDNFSCGQFDKAGRPERIHEYSLNSAGNVLRRSTYGVDGEMLTDLSYWDAGQYKKSHASIELKFLATQDMGVIKELLRLRVQFLRLPQSEQIGKEGRNLQSRTDQIRQDVQLQPSWNKLTETRTEKWELQKSKAGIPAILFTMVNNATVAHCMAIDAKSTDFYKERARRVFLSGPEWIFGREAQKITNESASNIQSQTRISDKTQLSDRSAMEQRCITTPKSEAVAQAERYAETVLSARKNRCFAISRLESTGSSKAGFEFFAKAEQGGSGQNTNYRIACQMFIVDTAVIQNVCK
jgi:uncharacterized protein